MNWHLVGLLLLLKVAILADLSDFSLDLETFQVSLATLFMKSD